MRLPCLTRNSLGYISKTCACYTFCLCLIEHLTLNFLLGRRINFTRLYLVSCGTRDTIRNHSSECGRVPQGRTLFPEPPGTAHLEFNPRSTRDPHSVVYTPRTAYSKGLERVPHQVRKMDKPTVSRALATTLAAMVSMGRFSVKIWARN